MPSRMMPRAFAAAALLTASLTVSLAASLAAQEAPPVGAAGPAAPAPVPSPPPSTFPVSRAASAITIDGELDEPAWAAAVPIALPYEWSPGDNVPAAVETVCLVTYDEDRLYVAFRASDPRPAEIRAHFADRDTPTTDDTVGFFLDPFADGRRAYQFRVNAVGVQMDAINDDVEGSEDFAWDAIWESAGRITADGYQVEAALPFRQLRFPAERGVQTWGFMAMRDYPRSLRHRFRSLVTERDRTCLICQFQRLAGFEGLRTGRNLELTPTLTGRFQEAREGVSTGPFATTAEDLDAGASARWGVTPNVFVSGTVNPDFSQVEADAAQLSANERFALFFPEKRPFFLEGADFFDTWFDLVFTRTVADPEAGLKVTGKSGRHAVGAFLARDRINNLLFPGSQGSSLTTLDREVDGAVARYRHDLGATSSVGALYAGRRGDGYDNHVAAVDAVYRVRETDTIRFQLAGSRTGYPEEIAAAFGQPLDTFSGHAGVLRYGHQDREWFWQATYEERHPGFRADSGFMTRVGVRTSSVGVERRFWGEEGGWFTNFWLFGGVDGTRGWEGEFEEWGGDLVAVWEGRRQSVVDVSLAPNREHFLGEDYDNLRYGVSFETELWPDVRLDGGVRAGETIDFANNQQADFVVVSPGISWKAGRGFEGRLDYDRQVLDVAGGRLFTDEIVQTRLLYHFSRRTFVRAIVQHRDIERDPALFPSPVPRVDERLLSQLLFSYKLNAQTVFLLGYSDNHLGRDAFDLTQTDRTLFLKIGYAWLL